MSSSISPSPSPTLFPMSPPGQGLAPYFYPDVSVKPDEIDLAESQKQQQANPSTALTIRVPAVPHALQNQPRSEKSERKSQEELNYPNFVTIFNNHYQARAHNREKALGMLQQLRRNAWYFENNIPVRPRSAEIPGIRIGLYEIFLCNDPILKETALLYLIEILECDPLEMDSANSLVELQSNLLKEIQADKAQNVSTKIQRLLIKAYAETIECILLHVASQHLNAVTEELKKTIWTGATTLAHFNVNKDPEIKFWTEYAIQAAQHLKTEKNKWVKWLTRIGLIAKAGLRVGSSIDNISDSVNALDLAYKDLKEALSHIESHQAWFEKLLIIKKMCRYSMCRWENFKKVAYHILVCKNQNLNELTADILDEKEEELSADQRASTEDLPENKRRKQELDSKKMLLYGLVSTLEHTVINSSNSKIQEESIKLLIQFFHVDVHLIQSRVYQTFARMLFLEGDSDAIKRLRNTAILVIKILQAYLTTQIQAEEQLALKMSFISLQNELFKHFEEIQTKRQQEFSQELCFSNVIKFLLRRLTVIKQHINYGGKAFITLLACSSEERVTTAILKNMISLSKEFEEPDDDGNTAYHLAVRYDNRAFIRSLKECKECVNISIDAKEYKKGNTALHCAVEKRNLALTFLLLELGANPNIRNYEGQTPLHLAIQRNQIFYAEKLLKHNADPTIVDSYGESPLDIADKMHYDNQFILQKFKENKKTNVRNLEACLWLNSKSDLWQKGDPNRWLKVDSDLWQKADSSLKIEASPPKEAINPSAQHPLNILEEACHSTPPGHRLAASNRAQDFEALLDGDPDISCQPDSSPMRRLPLHIAAQYGHLDILNIYIKKNLQLNKGNAFQNTAAHLATLIGHFDFLKRVKAAGANMSLKNKDGRIPLHLAATKENHKIIDELIETGLDEPDGNHDLPLHLACGSSPAIFQQLMTPYPQAVHAINGDVNTPFHLVCAAGNLDLVKLIAPHKPDLEARNIWGETPFILAAQAGHFTVVEYLVNTLGADIRARDYEGESALHKAVFNHHFTVVMFLLEKDRQQLLIHMQDSHKETPIHQISKRSPLLVSEDLLNLLRELLRSGSDIDQRNFAGQNILHTICFKGHRGLFNIVRNHFTHHSACKNYFQSLDHRKNNCLHMAAMGNQFDLISDILKLEIVDVNAQNTLKMTPLIISVQQGFHAITDLLIQNRAIVYGLVDKENRNLLHIILRKTELSDRDFDWLSYFIRNYPQLILGQDTNQQTPLHYLAENNHGRALNLILDYFPGTVEEKKQYVWKADTGNTAENLASQNKHFTLAGRLENIVF